MNTTDVTEKKGNNFGVTFYEQTKLHNEKALLFTKVYHVTI